MKRPDRAKQKAKEILESGSVMRFEDLVMKVRNVMDEPIRKDTFLYSLFKDKDFEIKNDYIVFEKSLTVEEFVLQYIQERTGGSVKRPVLYTDFSVIFKKYFGREPGPEIDKLKQEGIIRIIKAKQETLLYAVPE